MMPKKSTYGNWPSSGEIDIMESLGNQNLGSFNGGTNIGVEMSSSTLHWGPDEANNPFEKTSWVKSTAKGAGYDKALHLYQVEWTPGLKSPFYKVIFFIMCIFLDRLYQIQYRQC